MSVILLVADLNKYLLVLRVCIKDNSQPLPHQTSAKYLQIWLSCQFCIG